MSCIYLFIYWRTQPMITTAFCFLRFIGCGLPRNEKGFNIGLAGMLDDKHKPLPATLTKPYRSLTQNLQKLSWTPRPDIKHMIFIRIRLGDVYYGLYRFMSVSRLCFLETRKADSKPIFWYLLYNPLLMAFGLVLVYIYFLIPKAMERCLLIYGITALWWFVIMKLFLSCRTKELMEKT